MIHRLFATLFGGGRNVLGEVIGTIRPNAERSAQRAADAHTAALTQFAAEFIQPPVSPFDRLVNGLNRLPRPIMALGAVGFFAFLLYDPVAFASRMTPLELVPDELWWLISAVVTFYFGARELEKGRTRRKPGDVTRVVEAMKTIEGLRPADVEDAPEDHTPAPATESAGSAPEAPTPATAPATDPPTGNAAIDAWRASR